MELHCRHANRLYHNIISRREATWTTQIKDKGKIYVSEFDKKSSNLLHGSNISGKAESDIKR